MKSSEKEEGRIFVSCVHWLLQEVMGLHCTKKKPEKLVNEKGGEML